MSAYLLLWTYRFLIARNKTSRNAVLNSLASASDLNHTYFN